jgi:thymidylate synthase (FAD)
MGLLPSKSGIPHVNTIITQQQQQQNMKTQLISITKPLITAIHPGLELNPEDLIVYCARVSNPENQANLLTAPKLINYLISKKHWYPFEMVDMTVEIETSRAIAAQLLRHRSFSFQEFSQRYSKALGIQNIELRKQADKNRQSSSEVLGEVSLDTDKIDFPESKTEAVDLLTQGYHLLLQSESYYQRLLDRGVAKECARMFLPLATTSRLYMKGSVRSWIHFFQVRLHETAQKEAREIAHGVFKIFEENFPNITKSLLESGQLGVNKEGSL